MSKAYELSGVSLEAGYESVNRIKKHVAKTHRQGVFSGIGAFGAMFDLSELNYKKPLLVSGTDGVGTNRLACLGGNSQEVQRLFTAVQSAPSPFPMPRTLPLESPSSGSVPGLCSLQPF